MSTDPPPEPTHRFDQHTGKPLPRFAPPPPPAPPPSWFRRNWVMVAVCAGIFILGLGVGGASGSSDTSSAASTVTVTVTGSTSTATVPTSTTESTVTVPEVSANPDGKVTGTCDYVLGNFTESAAGFRFIADAQVENTGNIGLVVLAKATFQQLGSAPVVVSKKVKVKIGRSVTAHLNHIASSDELDLLQSANGKCHVTGTIVNTFGTAR